MSLYDVIWEKYCFVDKIRVEDDTEGGYHIVWKEGASFDAASRLDNSTVAKIAQAQGATAMYTIFTHRAVTLEFNDVIKRKSDGKVFRVKSDGDDRKTPPTASLDMRDVSAEEWVIPND